MEIKKRVSFIGPGSWAGSGKDLDLTCEHCGNSQLHPNTTYDYFYLKGNTPLIACKNCGKKGNRNEVICCLLIILSWITRFYTNVAIGVVAYACLFLVICVMILFAYCALWFPITLFIQYFSN